MSSLLDKLKLRINAVNHPNHSIVVQLRPLLSQPSVEAVLINHPDLRFSSKLLQLELDYLVIDELLPRRNHEMLEKGDYIHIASRAELKMVSFSCKVEEVIKTATGLRYKLLLPAKIKNKNRRESFRVRLNSNVRDVMSLSLPGNQMLIDPLIRDLSTQGFGMVLRTATHFQTGQIIEDAELILPDESVIRFDFMVCSVIESQRSGKCIYGNQIIRIDAREQRLLDNFIAQLQRSSRRKDSELGGSIWRK
ncbi:MAG: PilZ domain-containing protein [Pseudomonadales bacterium]|nr:PilZ domain-containing protein [Pseudomonadales bacterium]